MIITIILLLISLFLQGIIPNVLRGLIPIFIPVIILVSSTFNISNKKLYLVTFLFGILYDLTYTSFVFIHGLIFIFLLYLLQKILHKNHNFFKMIFTYYFISIIYLLIISAFSILISNINFNVIIQMYINSFILNSIYFFIIYIFFIVIKSIICNRNKKHSYFKIGDNNECYSRDI